MQSEHRLGNVLLAYLRKMGIGRLSDDQAARLENIPRNLACATALREAIETSEIDPDQAKRLVQTVSRFENLERAEEFAERGMYEAEAWDRESGCAAGHTARSRCFRDALAPKIGEVLAEARTLFLPLVSC